MNPLKQFEALMMERASLNSEILERGRPLSPATFRRLKRWFANAIRFMKSKDFSGSDGSDPFFRMVVTLRNNALGILKEVPANKIRMQPEMLTYFLTLPGRFNLKLGGQHEYEFGCDYFSWHIRNWNTDFAEFTRKHDNHILEIGSFEGFSSCWLADNLLNGPSSRLTCIDLFDDNFFRRFKSNVKLTGKKSQIKILKGPSGQLLRKLPVQSFNVIYIDGAHVGTSVLEDTILSWGLLKPGGVLIIDDYRLFNNYPESLSVKAVVDFFLKCHRSDLKVLRRGRQVVVRKVKNAA